MQLQAYADGIPIDYEGLAGGYFLLEQCESRFDCEISLRTVAAYLHARHLQHGVAINKIQIYLEKELAAEFSQSHEDVRLFLNCAHPNIHIKSAGLTSVEADQILGDRQFSPLYPGRIIIDPLLIHKMLDSGAYTDRDQRIPCEDALARQLAFERISETLWNSKWNGVARIFQPWLSEILCSYDWIIPQGLGADAAAPRLKETIANARFLASRRESLAPRQLMLICQGKDPQQYAECLSRILEFAQPCDMIGFGGWSWLGRRRSRNGLNRFLETISLCVPLLEQAGVQELHLMGVAWRAALGPLLYLCDRTGIRLSADTTTLVRAAVTTNKSKVGIWHLDPYVDMALKKTAISTIRDSAYYAEPLFQPDILSSVSWEAS